MFVSLDELADAVDTVLDVALADPVRVDLGRLLRRLDETNRRGSEVIETLLVLSALEHGSTPETHPVDVAEVVGITVRCSLAEALVLSPERSAHVTGPGRRPSDLPTRRAGWPARCRPRAQPDLRRRVVALRAHHRPGQGVPAGAGRRHHRDRAGRAPLVGAELAGRVPMVAGQLAQDVQDVQDVMIDTEGRWPACPVHRDEALQVEPELGPDPEWVCEHGCGVVAPLGALGPLPDEP